MNKILEKIETDKEVLSTMPTNNKKNIAHYIDTIKKLSEEYEKNKQEIFDELYKRYKKIIAINENKEIKTQKAEISEIENMLEIINPIKTSYEKMGLDKRVYKLGRFYKENLESINDEIVSCINKFYSVGINITADDFNYSMYVNEYMQVFFDEMKKEGVNSDIVKNKFEEIYWKCPDLIIHIELNIRYIYIKNQKQIDKYYEKRRIDLLNNINAKPEQIEEKYLFLKQKNKEKEESDKYILLQKFLNGELDINNYEEDKIKTEYMKLIPENIIKNASKKQMKEISQNSIKFLNSLQEYKEYLKFQFVFENIKNRYKDKEQYKNLYNTTQKEINSKEKKIKNLNSKMTSKGLFGKKDKKDKQAVEYNSTILEIKELYKKLDDAEIYSKIIEQLKDDSTIYDALYFASQFNNYLVDCIIENNKNITQEEIEQFTQDLKKFLGSPYNIITKNITILEEKDISIIISDRYKLLNFMISKEDITESNLDNLIDTLQKIKEYYELQKSGLDVEEIKFICDFKKILNKK